MASQRQRPGHPGADRDPGTESRALGLARQPTRETVDPERKQTHRQDEREQSLRNRRDTNRIRRTGAHRGRDEQRGHQHDETRQDGEAGASRHGCLVSDLLALLECRGCHQVVERRSPVQRHCPDCRRAIKRTRSREAIRRSRAES
jgi:hypothetical protein